MTQDQYITYIRNNLLELAVKKYPADPHRQMLYTIGFLQAQLAEAMRNDSLTAIKFKHQVQSITG